MELIQWIQANIGADDILAAIGAAYTIALIVVKVTPTPRDNKAVGDIAVWVTAICKVFGLTPFQGVAQKSPPLTAARPKAGR